MQAEEDETCAGCGQPLDECTDPRNEFGYYQAVAWRCHACTVKDAEGDKYDGAKPGIYLSVKKR